jgi:hypothetical protein
MPMKLKELTKKNYKVGDKVWATIKTIHGSYVGPVTIRSLVQEYHFMVKTPIRIDDLNEFLIFQEAISYTIEPEEKENDKVKEKVGKRKKKRKDA